MSVLYIHYYSACLNTRNNLNFHASKTLAAAKNLI